MSLVMQDLPPCEIWGTGFFSPAYATVADALADRPRELAIPPFALVEGRLRRFTSLVTQMHLEVCGQALDAAQVPAHSVIAVFASEVGETATSIELLRGIVDHGVASAARFAQSVHSAPSGIFSIATGNRLPTHALAAGPRTFERALFESRLLALETGRPVLLSIADDVVPELLGSERPGVALAAAFVISATTRPGAHALPGAMSLPPAPHLRGSALVAALAVLAASA